MPLDVLYEDNHLFAVAKPPGLAVQGARPGEASLWSVACAEIKERYNKPGNVFLGVVSRLDKPTSGAVVFARTSKAAARLAEQFRDRDVDKTYWAWVAGRIHRDEGEWLDYLAPDPHAPKQRVVGKAHVDAKDARLAYRVLERTEAATLVEVQLLTGRKHQIRVQFASRGHAIWGDAKYGSQIKLGAAIALHARRLVVAHPTLKTPVELIAPPPKIWGAVEVGREHLSLHGTPQPLLAVSRPSATTPPLLRLTARMRKVDMSTIHRVRGYTHVPRRRLPVLRARTSFRGERFPTYELVSPATLFLRSAFESRALTRPLDARTASIDRNGSRWTTPWPPAPKSICSSSPRAGWSRRNSSARWSPTSSKRSAGCPKIRAPSPRRSSIAGLISAWQNWHLLEGRCRGFFLGKYKLISYLNAGGMSRVYLAEHVLLKRRVAIKLFAEGPQDDGFRLKRFYVESEACAALNHPNIVKAFDFDSDGSFHFLVMEYVDGSDLHRLVARQGVLPFDRAADYVRQAALGLAHAHAAGMIHRDVKPANLLLDRDGSVKLLDLGVVRVTRQNETSLTLDQGVHIIGTVDYLPPEQFLDGHNVDARADLYSLGCTLFFLLTGRPPYNKGNQSQRIMMHQTEPPSSVFVDRPDCPAGLAQICERLMAKNPDDRFPSASDVARVLGDWLRLHKEGRDWSPPAPSGSWLKLMSEPDGASDTFRGTQLATLLSDQAGSASRVAAAPTTIEVRLQRVVEQLLSAARAGRQRQLATLLESFVLPEPATWLPRIHAADEPNSSAKDYTDSLPKLKGRFLRQLLAAAQFPVVNVEVASDSPIAGAAGVDAGVALTPLTVRLTPLGRRDASLVCGPFVFVGAAFRLLGPQRAAA